jgi:hypothetical protein
MTHQRPRGGYREQKDSAFRARARRRALCLAGRAFADDKVKISLWHSFIGADQRAEFMTKRMAQFVAANPDITVDEQKIPRALGEFTFDGKTYSAGLGVSITSMLFYNKALFQKYGVKVPTTYDELKAAVKVFAAKGIIPIAHGDKAKWPIQSEIFVIVPIFRSFVFGFYDWNGLSAPAFIGQIPLGLLAAVVGLLWSTILNSQVGILKSLFAAFGSKSMPDWLGDPHIAIYTLCGVIIWQFIGLFYMIIFLAALQNITKELIEEA